MELKKCLLTKNDCYKANRKMTPKGIVVHSTGANNPNLKRYVQPDDGILGKNTNNNDWNRSGLTKCVHAFIGLDKNGVVRCYQTLPFNICCWGVGSGSKGSYNYDPAYIQFEICEDNLTNKDYFTKAFDLAAEFCAYLIKEYNLKLDNVVSHHEAHLRGYGGNHGDCDHWLKKFGKTMDWFRNEVKAKLGETKPEEKKEEFNSYLVKVTANTLNVRAGAGTKYKVVTTVKKGEVYTIVDQKSNWGKLKSGSGWICLDYTEVHKEATKWDKGTYQLLVAKSIRTSHNLGDNIVKVKQCDSGTKKVLTSTKPNDNAKIKVGTKVSISKIYNEQGRIWGAYGNCWIVLCNQDGTPQAKKI